MKEIKKAVAGLKLVKLTCQVIIDVMEDNEVVGLATKLVDRAHQIAKPYSEEAMGYIAEIDKKESEEKEVMEDEPINKEEI